jgi:hypothetical protein
MLLERGGLSRYQCSDDLTETVTNYLMIEDVVPKFFYGPVLRVSAVGKRK